MDEAAKQLIWRKSSYSGNGDCVEVAFAGADVFVRDSKDQHGAVLQFTAEEWKTFLSSVCAGDSVSRPSKA
jgi:hypothetical protein